VAAVGRRLITSRRLNGAISGQRPNPNFGNIIFEENVATSNYQSLQVQYRRRLARGLQALVNYTWSHAIDESSNEDSISIGSLDRGNANFDVRHNLSSAVTYNLPWRGRRGVLSKLASGWSVDGIVHAQSGLPIDISARFLVREDGTGFNVRPDLVVGRPLYISDPLVPGSRRFNSTAFQQPPVGPNNTFVRQGTLGRNVLRGLPLYQVDAALKRQFNVTEKLNLQFRADAFNLFNRPNFGGFDANFNNPSTFGVPTQMLGRSLGGLSPLYQLGGPRSLQFSLRVGF
jgi:hypothetical protein